MNYNPLDLLPHRPPFLMIDKILDVDLENGAGTFQKNISHNEPYLAGHFPENPIFPGVLIIEHMAQCGAIILKLMKYEYDNYLLLKVDNFVVKDILRPGDVIISKGSLVKKKMDFFRCECSSYKEDKLVSSCLISCMGVKNK